MKRKKDKNFWASGAGIETLNFLKFPFTIWIIEDDEEVRFFRLHRFGYEILAGQNNLLTLVVIFHRLNVFSPATKRSV